MSCYVLQQYFMNKMTNKYMRHYASHWSKLNLIYHCRFQPQNILKVSFVVVVKYQSVSLFIHLFIQKEEGKNTFHPYNDCICCSFRSGGMVNTTVSSTVLEGISIYCKVLLDYLSPSCFIELGWTCTLIQVLISVFCMTEFFMKIGSKA